MLNNCDERNLKYCFCDTKNFTFKDKNGNPIQSIDNIVTKIFDDSNIIYKSSTLDDFVIKYEKINIDDEAEDKKRDPLKLLNKSQKNTLLLLVKNLFKNNADFAFVLKGAIDDFKIDKHNFYITLLDYTIPNVVFYQKNISYNLYFDGTYEETKHINTQDDLYIFKVKLKKK